MANQGTCAHDGCACKVREPHAVLQGGKVYCSDGCAAGQGCDHGGCTCSTTVGAQPSEDFGRAEASRDERSRRSS